MARLPGLLLVAALLAPVMTAGQVVFRGSVELVNFGVTVTDRRGNLVTDLTREDFTIVEDGRPQTIQHFGPALASGAGAPSMDGGTADTSTSAGLDVQLHPGLMLDTSGSMERDLALARTAAIKFLNLLPGSPDITLVDFDSEVRITRYPQRDFPRMIERIRGRKPEGQTALYDALGVYLDGAASQTGRPILVIYSDGADSRSELSYTEALDLLKASNVTVYAIGLIEHAGAARLESRMKLQTMTETTGGTALFPSSAKELDAFYARILDEIRGQYQLGYLSSNTGTDGRWREVSVRVAKPGLKVRTRKGYFAPYKPAARQ